MISPMFDGRATGKPHSMTTLTELKDRVVAAASAQGARYAGGDDRPLRGYVITMAVYSGLVGGLAGLARLTGRDIPDGFAAGDVALCAAATHKLSRLLAKDPVTSPLRAPFTSYRGTAGPSELEEEVRGQGGQKTIGELITCPFCTGVWVATGLSAGLVFLPRTTRIAMGTLAALAGADMLQFVHALLEKEAS
jgi:Protein of unknown function (DUF1360)